MLTLFELFGAVFLFYLAWERRSHTSFFSTTPRAGLNEREAPGKVVTARPPKR